MRPRSGASADYVTAPSALQEGCAETEDGRCVCSDREGNTFDTSKLGPRPAGGFFTFGPALLPWVEYKLVFGFCAAVPLPENCCRPADGCDPSSPTLAYRMDEDRSPDHPRDSNCEYFSDGGSMHVSVQRIDPEPGHTPERSGGVAMKWECVRPVAPRAHERQRTHSAAVSGRADTIDIGWTTAR